VNITSDRPRQNKPNCPKRGTEAVSRRGRVGRGPRDVGQMRKTNPILGGAGRPSRAPRPSGRAPAASDCAKQSQYPGTGRSAGRLYKPRRAAALRAKPIPSAPTGTVGGRQGRRWSATGDNRAKQTQFAATPRGTRPEGRGAIAQNEPNFGQRIGRGQGAHGTNRANLPPGGHRTIPSLHHSSIPSRPRLCETNPISGKAGWGAAWGTRGVGSCTNKPNSRRSATAASGMTTGIGFTGGAGRVTLGSDLFMGCES
jgi:hypothetical protein